MIIAPTADQRLSAGSGIVIVAFTEFGIDEVVGDRTCFINMTREFLTGELVLPFGPEHVPFSRHRSP